MSLSQFVAEGNVGNFEHKTVPVNGEEKFVLNISFRVDVKSKGPSGQWDQDHGYWADVEFWGKRSKPVADLLKVGARIVVIGDSSMQSFTTNNGDQPGTDAQRLKIRAESISFAAFGIDKINYKEKSIAQ